MTEAAPDRPTADSKLARLATNWLSTTGWLQQRQEPWFHHGLNLSLPQSARWSLAYRGQLAHVLREGWRWTHFNAFLDSGHHVANDMQDCQYDSARMQRVRKVFYESTGAQRAVMIGAVLTPGCASKWRQPPPNRHDREGLCLFCDTSFGNFKHIFWECPCRPEGLTRDPPEDPLQPRFGWPIASTREDAQVLQHMSAICELIWANRWGREGQQAMGHPDPSQAA